MKFKDSKFDKEYQQKRGIQSLIHNLEAVSKWNIKVLELN